MNLRINRRTLIIQTVIGVAAVLAGSIWFMGKTQPHTDQIGVELALARNVVGCEKYFEGVHVRWPRLAEDSKCQGGWDLRDDNEGKRLSELADWFAYQRYFDLLIIAAIVLSISLLVQWLLVLTMRSFQKVFRKSGG